MTDPPRNVSAAWETYAWDRIAWASAPDHDGFWLGTWPALQDLLPSPRGLTLDLGCGEGRAGRQLSGRGYDVIGVERSPTLAIAASTTDHAFPIALADATAIPLRNGSASLVVASMLLQDVDDLDTTVREIARVLRSDGVLCAAIVHPFSSAFDEETIETPQTSIPNPSSGITKPYLEPRRYEMEIERDGLRMKFVSMHWPLSTYMNLLAREDLVITAILEAGDNEVPWLLAFRAERRG